MFYSQFCYQRPINLHSLECDAETRCEHSSYTFSNCAAFLRIQLEFAHPSGRAVSGVALRPLTGWDCGLESLWGHGCLSFVLYVIIVEVSASS
jgi:hypothetical protein